MTYDPYRHASELGVTIRWDDDAPGSGAGFDRDDNSITLPTDLPEYESRARLTILLVYAENPSAKVTAHSQLSALRTATARLIRATDYNEVAAHVPDRRYMARALGVTEEMLSLYERLNSPYREKDGHTA
jgi:hypothetical protein